MRTAEVRHFEEWRSIAKQFLAEEVPPDQISWYKEEQEGLFADEKLITPLTAQRSLARARSFTAPKSFIEKAVYVSCHRAHERWALMYRLIWRLNHGERQLMSLASDADTKQFHQWFKAVKRDRHKMKAFVRFKKCQMPPDSADNSDKSLSPDSSSREESWYVAWHDPSHLVLPITMPFFVRRFHAMNFVILTPDISAMWNGRSIVWGEGCARKDAPQEDEVESLWLTYYANIFNPARIKLKAMQSELPKKFWHTLPETEVMKQMLREAPARVEQMIEDSRDKNYLADK